jgi:hypothetical protein
MEEMNVALCKDFSNEEISNALLQIGPLKVPGPDGMSGRFFQQNWALMKNEVITGIKNFSAMGLCLKASMTM